MVDKNVPIVDFHAHILPFVDHGSASPEMSETLLVQAKKAGVAMIVATPHFYAHLQTVDDFIEKRNAGYEALMQYLREKNMDDIPMVLGAEVALERGLVDLPDLKRLAIGQTNYILIEMPMFGRWQSWMYNILYEIQSRHNVQVILAHVDRYSSENTSKLFDMGFLAQANASAFINGSERKKMLSLCEEGVLHLIGSDVHDDKERNYKNLITARKKIGKETLSYFYSNAMDILG